ncbi:hypothetical protein ACP70R_010470 [Stipagrostis hirtigluma subsp. patula]
MASLFGARRRRSPEDDGEDDRSGSGRVQRRRLSPEEDAASPAGAAAGRSPGWLSSFVSGARRVFSSVLLFSSPEEAASGDEDEDDDGEEGNGLSSGENVDVHDTHGAIVPYSESKIAIEQMVMKETFSRDECDKMVQLIKSRVTDATFPEACEYGTPKENTSKNAGSGHGFTEAWRSMSRSRNFLESVPFSGVGAGSFSPGSPLQASPELCTAAVTEAKKWLEEKRRGLNSKPEDNGPCTFNTDMLSSGADSDMGSPVDLAKSYMRSLPPWQSPILGSQKFNLSSSGGVNIYSDDGRSKYSISSSKVTTKEDYLSNFWANLEESRRARIGSSGRFPDSSKLGHYGSTSRLFENDSSIFSTGPHEKVAEPAQTNKETIGSGKIAAAGAVSGCSEPVAPTKDGNDGVVEHVDPAKDNGEAHEKYHASTEVHPDKVAEGNMSPTRSTLSCTLSCLSVTKDAVDQSGVAEAPSAEPVSEFRPQDAGLPMQLGMNGSTSKTPANGLLDQSKANSGLESSGNNNPSCTNSNSAVPPTSNHLMESAGDAADGDSLENGTEMDPKGSAKRASRSPYVRRGQKRVTRVTRGKGK